MITSTTQTCCPFCSALQSMPDTGQNHDVMLCINCGEFCEIEDGHLAIPSDDTYDAINSDPKIMRAKQAWLATRGRMQ